MGKNTIFHRTFMRIKYVKISTQTTLQIVCFYCYNTKATINVIIIITVLLLIGLIIVSSPLVQWWNKKKFRLERHKRDDIEKDKSRRSLNF